MESPTTAMQMTHCNMSTASLASMFLCHILFLHLNSGKTEVLVLGPDSFSKDVYQYIGPSPITSNHLLFIAFDYRLNFESLKG